jgi:hypothetical protein
LAAPFDDDVSGVAAWDAKRRRLAVVLVNFRDRYALGRNVRLQLDRLTSELRRGTWKESVVDATHANVWNDPAAAELAVTRSGPIAGRSLDWTATLAPNSVTLLELTAP